MSVATDTMPAFCIEQGAQNYIHAASWLQSERVDVCDDSVVDDDPTAQTAAGIAALKPVTLSHQFVERRMGLSLRSRILTRDLQSYRRLSDGWDGSGSRAPSPQAMSDIETFLARMPPGIPLPRASLTPAGEPGLYWDERDYYLEAEFQMDGIISIFAQDKKGVEHRKWHLDSSNIDDAIEVIARLIAGMSG